MKVTKFKGKRAPYLLFSSQKKYIHFIVSHSSSEVIFLEAPTGFGKTICNLLSGIILGERMAYLSRTHNQNRQVCNELKRLDKINSDVCSLSATQLASRKKYCHYSFVREERNPTKALAICRSNRSAALREGDETSLKCRTMDLPLSIYAEEDLVELGKRYKKCPYYSSRELVNRGCDLVTGSYFYLLDKNISDIMELDLNDYILFLDEGHNLESICCHLGSVELTNHGLNDLLNYLSSYPIRVNITELLRFLVKQERDQEKSSYEGEEFRSIIFENFEESWIEELRVALNFFESINLPYEERMKILRGLREIVRFFDIFEEKTSKKYGVLITREQNRCSIKAVCLDASLIFERMKNARLVIVCSGTLSPISLTSELLGVKGYVSKSFPSLIKNHNARLYVVGKYFSVLSSRYKQRNEETFLNYRRAIQRLLKLIPPSSGALVFFPSKSFMKEVNLQSQIRLIFDTYQEAYQDFCDSVDVQRTALISFYNSRIAEGSDFPDNLCRLGIFCGIQFPQWKDYEVQMRRQYLNKKQKGLGDRYYFNKGYRSLNQAIGRIWRHKADWGIGVILEDRLTTNLDVLPYWLTDQTTVRRNWKKMTEDIYKFFKSRTGR